MVKSRLQTMLLRFHHSEITSQRITGRSIISANLSDILVNQSTTKARIFKVTSRWQTFSLRLNEPFSTIVN